MKALLESFTGRLLKVSAANFVEDSALRLSAALAYYSAFALAPLLLITLAVVSAIYGEKALQDQLAGKLQSYMGRPAAEAVQEIIKNNALRSKGTGAAIIGFITLLVAASGFFAQLKDALNTVWQVQQKPGCTVKEFIRDRLLSFGMILMIGFLLLLSVTASTVLAGVSSYTEHVLAMPDFVWTSLNFLVALAITTLLFIGIFKVLPDVHVPWRTVITGGFITALLFEAGKFALAFYLGRESTASSFGAAGSVILILLWVYYACAILLFGAEITQSWAQLTGTRVRLKRLAVPVQPPKSRHTLSNAPAEGC
jgi:membrane protein